MPVQAGLITRWGTECLEKAGMRPQDALQVAGSLVQTSVWGVDSHGIARLPHYLDRLTRGSIVAQPHTEIVRTGPGTAYIEGGAGHGIVLSHLACKLARDMALESGIAAVGVTNSSHCGALALYTRPPAREGLIAIGFTHSDSMAAPFGGIRPFFGTNPISIAMPRQGAEPLCLDMATTSIPWNRVMNARRENHPIPEGTALDALGAPTTDPHAAASLVPVGGTDYGHKGYGLALMVDLMCGPLQGNPFGPDIPGMFTEMDAQRKLGAFFIFMDPRRFAGGALLATVVAQLAERMQAEPGSPLMPGDPENRTAQVRQTSGIPIERGLAQQMQAWSDQLGVAPIEGLAG